MSNSAWTSALWYVAILAMIPVVLWLLKRSPAGERFSGATAGAGAMKQIAALPLSPNQRIVTVEVGHGEARRWLVLGVTPQQISALHTLLPPNGMADVPPGTAPPTPTSPVFGQLLGRLRQGRDKQ